MKQLTLGDIINRVAELRNSGMSIGDVRSLPVYIGDDDELNGIHCAWYSQLITDKCEEDTTFIEQINENRCNIPFNKRAFLIS